MTSERNARKVPRMMNPDRDIQSRDDEAEIAETDATPIEPSQECGRYLDNIFIERLWTSLK